MPVINTNRKNIYIIILTMFSLLWAIPLSAQPYHDRKSDPLHEKVYIPRVTCTIDAHVQPQSSRVSVRMEILYKNREKTPTSRILFYLPVDTNNNSMIRIDSILYRGAPVPRSQWLLHNGLLTVTLPGEIHTDEKAFFLMSFTCSLQTEIDNNGDTTILLLDWFPRVAVYRHGKWHTGQDGNRYPHEFAEYHVGIRLDTSYDLAYEGLLVNEREHLGLLPRVRDGVVLEDIASHGIIPNGKPFYPIFPSGEKQYFIRVNNTTDFKAVIRHRWIQDRVKVDNVTITAYYPQAISSKWAKSVVTITRDMLSQYVEFWGAFPYHMLSVVSVSSVNVPYGEPFIAVSPDNTDTKTIAVEIAMGIARCWLPGILSDKEGESRTIADGIASYMAAIVLHGVYGEHGYRMMQTDYTYRDNKTSWNVATWLYLRHYMNGDAFQKDMRSLLVENRYRVITSDNFYNIFDDSVRSPIRLTDVPRILDSMDIQVVGYDILPANNGYLLTCDIKMQSAYPFPIEVAVIHGNDTLWDTLMFSGDSNSRSQWYKRYEKELRSYPDKVMLDPRYLLPDINRSNNDMSIRRKHYWRRSTPTPFPGFTIGRGKEDE